VAAALAKAGRTVLVSAGPGEAGLAREVEQSSGGAAQRAEAGDLPRLVSMLAGAALVRGGDTGPLHLAHALGAPTLFLHGPTDPATHGPYGAPERTLRGAPPDGGWSTAGASRNGLVDGVDLPVELVVERALALAREPGAPPRSGG
jgi:ADP-heptose:LPS heptosyltransferase